MTSQEGNRRQRMRGEDRRRLIQASSADLFATQGYERTTMAEIAVHAGLKKGSLYYFYQSKEVLLFDLLRAAMEIPRAPLERIASSELSAMDKLRGMVSVLVQAHAEFQPLMIIFTREDVAALGDDEMRDQILKDRRAFELLWEDVIAAGVASNELRQDLDVKLTAFAIIGMINWMFKWYKAEGRASVAEISHVFSELILRGMEPESP